MSRNNTLVTRGPRSSTPLGPAQLQIAIQGLRLLTEVAITASDVIKLHEETKAFLVQVDALEQLLMHDAEQVWRIIEPFTKALLSFDISPEERKHILEAIQKISEPSLRARASAISSVAQQIKNPIR